jgi:hypothetical protein
MQFEIFLETIAEVRYVRRRDDIAIGEHHKCWGTCFNLRRHRQRHRDTGGEGVRERQREGERERVPVSCI